MRASKPKSLYALKINQFSCDPEVSLFFGGIFAAILNVALPRRLFAFHMQKPQVGLPRLSISTGDESVIIINLKTKGGIS
jgi:hypothetical protein